MVMGFKQLSQYSHEKPRGYKHFNLQLKQHGGCPAVFFDNRSQRNFKISLLLKKLSAKGRVSK